MIRGALIERHAGTSDELRWWSFEPTRLEGLAVALATVPAMPESYPAPDPAR